MNLLLYFATTSEALNISPVDFAEPEGYVFFDMDSESGNEVSYVALRALKEFGKGIILIDAREPGPISALFPILKKALGYGDKFQFVSIGNHEQLLHFKNKSSHWYSVATIDEAVKIIETISSSEG